jgi:uncharacterized protein involved in copper resistance
MEPIQNLKRFLAVLIVLILPAALTVAYFRNYSPDAKHEHGTGETAPHHADTQSKPAETEKTKPMDHGNMPGMQPSKSPESTEQPMPHDTAMSPAPPPTQEQLEASRLQLEASRLQLEASRKQLEAAEAAKSQPTSPAPAKPPPSPSPDGHDHKH